MGFNRFSPLLLALALAGCVNAGTPALVPPPTPPQPTPAVSVAAPAPSPAASPAPASPSPSPSMSPSPSPTPVRSSGGSSSGGSSHSPTPAPTPVTSMYVLNGLGKTIDQVDLSTGTVTQSILTTGLYPNQLHRAGADTYLVNSGDANIFRLDLLTPAKLDTIDLAIGSNPFTMYPLPAPRTDTLIVNYLDSDGDLLSDVAFLDLATKTVDPAKTVDLPTGNPAGGALIHNGKAYVPAIAATYGGPPDYQATYTFSGVYVIDLATHTLAKTIALPDDANPGDISRDPNSGLIHVCTKAGITLIDPATDEVIDGGLVSTVPIHAIRYVSATLAYAAVYDGLVSFNPATQTFIRDPSQKIPAGDTSVGGFVIRDGKAYVPNFATDTVTVVDLATEAVVGTPYAVGDGPQAVVFQTSGM